MAHEHGKLMDVADEHGPMSGHVEVEETRIGGYQSREDRREKGSNKTVILGMVERGDGRLRAGPISDTAALTLAPIIASNIAHGTTITTDEWAAYGMLTHSPYVHGSVNHKAEEWVRGIHHTNTIEGHWSLLKRAIKGTHTHVSAKHLWKYVSEFSYRRNMRHSHALMFDHLLVSISRPRLQAG